MLPATLWAALVMVPLAAISGCSSESEGLELRPSDPPTSESTSEVGPTIVTFEGASPRTEGTHVGNPGVLSVNPQGCLAVGDLVLTVPEGSVFDDDQLTLPDGTSYAIGASLLSGIGNFEQTASQAVVDGLRKCGGVDQYAYLAVIE